ncbi:MAG TPA: tetratricopeptide repeat protein [Bacteroidia bacterium]|nr:tetratricopeptide repeat protein [Bacteroidia bacterium]
MTRIISIIDIKKLAAEIYADRTNAVLVANFEKHQQEIDAVDYNESQEIYDIYSGLIANYGIALAQIDQFKKAIPVLNKAIQLFENNKEYSFHDLLESNLYVNSYFNLGYSYCRRNKYKLAKPYFEFLIKHFPENLHYANWLNRINSDNLIRLRDILMYCLTGSLLIETFYGKEYPILKYLGIGLWIPSLIISIILGIILYNKEGERYREQD